MALLTLEEAKAHLNITHNDADADIYRKVEQASAIVLGFMEQGSPEMTEADVPLPVQAVALLALAYLHEHRGDAPDKQEAFWFALRQMLNNFGYARPSFR